MYDFSLVYILVYNFLRVWSFASAAQPFIIIHTQTHTVCNAEAANKQHRAVVSTIKILLMKRVECIALIRFENGFCVICTTRITHTHTIMNSNSNSAAGVAAGSTRTESRR